MVHGPYPLGEPRIEQQVRVARKLGYDVEIVAARRPREHGRENLGGTSVTRLPFTRVRGRGILGTIAEYFGFTFAATLLVAARAVRRRYDVVQVANPPDWLLVAALIPRALGARVVFDVHDLAPDMFAMRFADAVGSSVAAHVLRRAERAAVRAADVVLTVHEPYRRALLAHGLDADKVIVVMNSPDDELLPPERDRGSTSPFRIVYHGTITAHYGVDLLVRAAARVRGDVPDLEVHLCGEGDALETVLALARDLGVDDAVHATEKYLSKRDALRLAASASVGVIPNLPIPLNRYALSSKLLDYVALGVPAVAADLPTIRDHFSSAEVRFFEAGNVDALAEALRDVARDPDAARRRAAAALRRYEEYRWAVSAERYAVALGSAP